MSRYYLGQPVRVSTTVRDVTGTLVDAGTLTLTVKIRNADGTLTVTGTYASPAHDSTGTYHQDIPAADLTVIAHYQYVWTSTGTGAGVSVGDFDIADPDETAVLPLQDGKDHLNIPQTVTTYDAEINAMIATIEASLRGATGGPIVNRTITAERVEMTSDQAVIILRQRPVVSVTTIVAESSGSPVDISGGLDIDANAGIIRRKLTGWPFILPMFAAQPIVLVTYVAGWGQSVPATFNLFARIVLANLWDTQHGPSQRPQMGGQEMTTPPGFAFAIPNRAAELLAGMQDGMPFLSEAFV